MRNPHLTGAAQLADTELKQALAGRCLVTFDRFTSAGRTATLGPMPIAAARAHLHVGYYSSWPAAAAGTVLAAEERTGHRDSKAKHRWLDEMGNTAAAACAQLPGDPLFAAWYASPAMSRLARLTGATLLTVPASVHHTLEDKTDLDDLLRLAGVPDGLRIPAFTAAQDVTYAQAAARLGPHLVIQPPLTSGGRGTVFADHPGTFTLGTAGAGPWRISQYVDGFCANTTVLTLPRPGGCQVYVDVPSHKPVGVTAMGIPAGKGAGNDWSPPWPRQQANHLVDAIVRLGEYLYAVHGLIGLWGVDSIFTAGTVAINEINIRNQGTTELSGVNQLLRGMPPLLIAHLTVLSGGAVSWLPSAGDFNHGTVAQAGAGGRAPFYLKLRNRNPHPVTPAAGWNGPGVYRLTGAGLMWQREGAHPLDADLDLGEVLLANAPAAGVVCTPGAELGTIEGVTTRALFDGPDRLSPLGIEVYEAAQAQFMAGRPEGGPR